jgi:hypothetical protein
MSQTKKTEINKETDLDKKIEIYLKGYNKESVKTKIKELGLKDSKSLSFFNNNFKKKLDLTTFYAADFDMIKLILEEK